MLWGKTEGSEKPAVAGNRTQGLWLELPVLYHWAMTTANHHSSQSSISTAQVASVSHPVATQYVVRTLLGVDWKILHQERIHAEWFLSFYKMHKNFVSAEKKDMLLGEKWKAGSARTWTHDSWLELPVLYHSATTTGPTLTTLVSALLHHLSNLHLLAIASFATVQFLFTYKYAKMEQGKTLLILLCTWLDVYLHEGREEKIRKSSGFILSWTITNTFW